MSPQYEEPHTCSFQHKAHKGGTKNTKEFSQKHPFVRFV